MIGTLLGVVLAFVAFRLVRFHTIEARLASVKPGMRQAQVDSLLGGPSTRSVGCRYISLPSSACSLEYDYSHPLAPVLPEYIVVLFNDEGRVTNAYHTTSP